MTSTTDPQNSQQPAADVYDRLLNAGIVAEYGEEPSIRLTQEYLEHRAETRSRRSELGRTALLETVGATDGELAKCADEALTTEAVSVFTFGAELSEVEAFRVAASLHALRDEPDAEGVPPSFLRLHPAQIPGFLSAYDAGVILCWREDCSPCREMAERLEELVRNLPDVTVGAVRGTDDPALLSERYDVSVAPTLLFCADGEICSRLIGVNTAGTVQRELSLLSES